MVLRNERRYGRDGETRLFDGFRHPLSSIYAERITDEKLRSRFLVEMLRFTLRKGFSDDFNVYVDDVCPLITDRKALEDLAEIEKQYLTLREKNKDLLRGMEMPDLRLIPKTGKLIPYPT